MTKLWQLMQRKDTKNLNVDKDLDEILSKKKNGRNESTKTRKFRTKDDNEDQ